MAAYIYTKSNEDDQVVFRIYQAGRAVASARLMVPTQDFESYSVNRECRGLGLSYALTYAMLVYCRKKGYKTPQVSNAHGPLLHSLPKSGFRQVGATRVVKRSEQAASFQCMGVDYAISECNRELGNHHITLQGPVKASRSCVIL